MEQQEGVESDEVLVCKEKKPSLTIENGTNIDPLKLTVKVRRPNVGFMQISKVEVYTTKYTTKRHNPTGGRGSTRRGSRCTISTRPSSKKIK